MQEFIKDIPKIERMQTPRGAEAPDQFTIETKDFTVFQSYATTIAVKCKKTGKVVLDEYAWNYSKMTSTYRNRFLDMTSKEVKAAIESGEIKLTKLN